MTMNYKLKVNFLAHFSDGIMLSTFGPIIPFFSEATNQTQADFNYIFALRGIAYIIAGILQKTYARSVKPELRMQICLFFCGIFFILFGTVFQDSFWLSIVSFILNIFIGSISIISNIILMDAGKENTKYFVSLSYGIYGIGGMLGPIIVSIVGLKSLIVIGVWCLALSGFYFKHSQEPQSGCTNQLNQKLNPEKKQFQQKVLGEMSSKSQLYLCIMFLLYSSITLSFRSWLPSFAVMQKITTKQNAALSVSLYSIFLTIFRFVFLLLNVQIETLLRYTSIGLFITITASLLTYVSSNLFIVFGNSMILGILFSNYCPYLYSLPSRFNRSMNANTTSNTIIAYAMGEAVVSALIGYLMDVIHPLMLFVSILFFAIINIMVLELTIYSLRQDNQEIPQNQAGKDIQLRELKEKVMNSEWSFDRVKKMQQIQNHSHKNIKSENKN